MTVIRHNSISGIVSITAAAGSNLSFYDSTGATLSLDTGDINAGVITATTANFTNATVTGDLTVQGTTTTLDTTVTEVDKLEVGANNTTVGVAITQSGTGDILRLYDSSTQVVTVADGGNIGIGSESPRYSLDISGGNLLVSGSAAGNLILEDRSVADGSRPFALLASNDGNFTITNANRNASGTTTGSSERLRITSDGKIGINSTSPLEIVDIVHNAPKINATATNGLSGFRLNVASGYGSQTFRVQEGGTTVFTIQNGGDILIPNGKGIDFSATSDGSGASNVSELLDDYEEGTWTPVLEGSTTNPTYSGSQSGVYTKVGNMVTCWGYIDTNPVTGAGSGNISISGLPFASGLPTASTFNGSVAVYGPTFSGTLSSRINNTSTSIIFYQIASNTAISQWTFATASWSSGDAIYFQVSYTV